MKIPSRASSMDTASLREISRFLCIVAAWSILTICTGAAQEAVPVPAAPSADEPVRADLPETEWVEGQPVLVHRNQRLEVRAALDLIPKEVTGRGRELRVFVAVSNLSGESVRMSPVDVRLEKVRVKKRGAVVREGLPLWKPEEYERDLNGRIAATGFWYGFLRGMSAPQLQQSTVRMDVHDAHGLHAGSVTGTVTTPPSGYEQYLHQEALRRDLAALHANMARSKEEVLAGLLRPTTVPPRHYVSGTVYFYYWRGEHYSLIVPIGETTFEFPFKIVAQEELEQAHPQEGVAHPLDEE